MVEDCSGLDVPDAGCHEAADELRPHVFGKNFARLKPDSRCKVDNSGKQEQMYASVIAA